jgi:hypothetical protein
MSTGKVHVAPAPSGKITNWMELPVWTEIPELKQQTICKDLHAKDGREVLYPQSLAGSFTTEPNDTIPSAGQNSGLGILIVYGCMAYKSPVVPGERHSSFCWFFLPGEMLGSNEQRRCPVGYYAD